jgi:hypothetical protein
VHSISFTVDPSQFLAGWREKAGTLFLPTLSESRVGDEVAVRLGIQGHAIRATLCGKVGLVRRVGRPTLPPGVELHLERQSLAAAAFLAAAARGEPVSFKDRAPRWAARRPLQLEHGGVGLEVLAVNLSEGGCAVVWSGTLPLPSVGDAIAIRLKDGFLTRAVRSVVCWTDEGAPGGERRAGLKVVAEGRAARAWRTLVDAVARSGARPA